MSDCVWLCLVSSCLTVANLCGFPVPSLRSRCLPALNGFLFGNFPEPEMCVGESVSWHLFGMGNEIDIHSIYFYGNTFVSRGHRTDVVNLFPATFLTAEMIVESPGKWMITCQVSDHLQGEGLLDAGLGHLSLSLMYWGQEGMDAQRSLIGTHLQYWLEVAERNQEPLKV